MIRWFDRGECVVLGSLCTLTIMFPDAWLGLAVVWPWTAVEPSGGLYGSLASRLLRFWGSQPPIPKKKNAQTVQIYFLQHYWGELGAADQQVNSCTKPPVPKQATLKHRQMACNLGSRLESQLTNCPETQVLTRTQRLIFDYLSWRTHSIQVDWLHVETIRCRDTQK